MSLNALTGTKAFVVPGIIKDVSLAYGFDANAKNTAFGPKKRDVVGGLNFAFDVPAGFLNASVHAYKEWNRNGFNVQPNRDVSFDTVPEFEIVYSIPLPFTGLPLSLAGFNNIVLPKGRGVRDVSAFASNPKTGLEFLSRTNLVLDVGQACLQSAQQGRCLHRLPVLVEQVRQRRDGQLQGNRREKLPGRRCIPHLLSSAKRGHPRRARE